MYVALNPTYRLARLNSLLAALTADTRVDVYDGAVPAPGDPPAGTKLLEFTPPSPYAAVDTGLVQLAFEVPASPSMALASGDATWARVRVGTTWMVDLDVTNAAGTGAVKLTNTTVVAGALVAMLYLRCND